MLRPRLTPISPPAADTAPLPTRFTLLVWNAHKLPMHRLAHCHLPPADLWLLQEARVTVEAPPPWPHWFMSPNLHRPRCDCGVLTASRYDLAPLRQFLSQRRELRWLTHKSALLTRHPLPGGDALWLLNAHMLLTRGRRHLRAELDSWSEALAEHHGPLIVAGDFNTWSRTRLRLLRHWAERHGLIWPQPDHAHHVRHHAGQPLDHLLYRDLTLERFEALETPCSDHNPLWAHFSL